MSSSPRACFVLLLDSDRALHSGLRRASALVASSHDEIEHTSAFWNEGELSDVASVEVHTEVDLRTRHAVAR